VGHLPSPRPEALTGGADDPYYYLYYGAAPRAPSYFTLERTLLPAAGRVLRFDSLSKILSAGIRIGFATGPAPLLDALDLHVRPLLSSPCVRTA
jgi:DNA-binding transcriptional MocR family regulator